MEIPDLLTMKVTMKRQAMLQVRQHTIDAKKSPD
jgi:hypothetical protein